MKRRLTHSDGRITPQEKICDLRERLLQEGWRREEFSYYRHINTLSQEEAEEYDAKVLLQVVDIPSELKIFAKLIGVNKDKLWRRVPSDPQGLREILLKKLLEDLPPEDENTLKLPLEIHDEMAFLRVPNTPNLEQREPPEINLDDRSDPKRQKTDVILKFLIKMKEMYESRQDKYEIMNTCKMLCAEIRSAVDTAKKGDVVVWHQEIARASGKQRELLKHVYVLKNLPETGEEDQRDLAELSQKAPDLHRFWIAFFATWSNDVRMIKKLYSQLERKVYPDSLELSSAEFMRFAPPIPQ